MIHVTLILAQLSRKLRCAAPKSQIILEPLPLLWGQLLELFRKQRIARRQVVELAHDDVEVRSHVYTAG